MNRKIKVEWFPGMDGRSYMLYRLPEVATASADCVIFVVEGEKDVDTLTKLGLIATTNSSGAGKWRDEFSRHLAGRDVVILPDNDVGRDHADKVLQSLHNVARSVKVIELDGLADKGDVSDWIEAGHTRDELLSLAYARMTTEQPRQCVFFGTTNSSDYLRDMTGNRRFWPVRIEQFDLEALTRDRDRLWAASMTSTAHSR